MKTQIYLSPLDYWRFTGEFFKGKKNPYNTYVKPENEDYEFLMDEKGINGVHNELLLSICPEFKPVAQYPIGEDHAP
jgi:hypothetical protein